MATVKIIIEKSSDYYNAYAENCEGVYGAGDTVEESKTNTIKGLELLKETRAENEWPEILKGDYNIESVRCSKFSNLLCRCFFKTSTGEINRN
jgi:predicted RNase H-like HicB family nuclease